jgi:hypothetical protein
MRGGEGFCKQRAQLLLPLFSSSPVARPDAATRSSGQTARIACPSPCAPHTARQKRPAQPGQTPRGQPPQAQVRGLRTQRRALMLRGKGQRRQRPPPRPRAAAAAAAGPQQQRGRQTLQPRPLPPAPAQPPQHLSPRDRARRPPASSSPTWRERADRRWRQRRCLRPSRARSTPPRSSQRTRQAPLRRSIAARPACADSPGRGSAAASSTHTPSRLSREG